MSAFPPRRLLRFFVGLASLMDPYRCVRAGSEWRECACFLARAILRRWILASTIDQPFGLDQGAIAPVWHRDNAQLDSQRNQLRQELATVQETLAQAEAHVHVRAVEHEAETTVAEMRELKRELARAKGRLDAQQRLFEQQETEMEVQLQTIRQSEERLAEVQAQLRRVENGREAQTKAASTAKAQMSELGLKAEKELQENRAQIASMQRELEASQQTLRASEAECKQHGEKVESLAPGTAIAWAGFCNLG